MLDTLKIAGYFYKKYETTFGHLIDEMKLHKLIYFFLRECLIEKGDLSLDVTFEARQFGPVSPKIRTAYKTRNLKEYPSDDDLKVYGKILEEVFNRYAKKNSWSLSSLTHGEESWIKARERYENYGDPSIRIEDIKKDASRIRIRRYVLNETEL